MQEFAFMSLLYVSAGHSSQDPALFEFRKEPLGQTEITITLWWFIFSIATILVFVMDSYEIYKS